MREEGEREVVVAGVQANTGEDRDTLRVTSQGANVEKQGEYGEGKGESSSVAGNRGG